MELGDGCSTFVSMSLGMKDTEDAKTSVGSAVVTVVTSSLVLTAFYLIFSTPIITFFGGKVNEQTFAFAKEYFWFTLQTEICRLKLYESPNLLF